MNGKSIQGWRKFGIALITIVGLILAGCFYPAIPSYVVVAVATFSGAYCGIQGFIDKAKENK
jgi:hypothetical protein